MKKILFALVAVLSAATASAAEGGAKLGIGAAFGADQAAITVPYNLAHNLRIEPFVGYSRVKTVDSTDPAGDVTDTASKLELGTGVFFLKQVGANVELIAGGKVRIDLDSTKNKDVPANTDTSDSFWGWGIAAVGGAEYYFSPRFALGVEAELGFHSAEVATDVRESTIETASFVTAKVFFQ